MEQERNQRIVAESVSILSRIVNLSTGLAHPLDESGAKELFIALRDRDIPFTQDQVHDLAVKNGWPDRHASKLSELAGKIADGGRVQIKHPRGWGESTVDRVIQSLSEES